MEKVKFRNHYVLFIETSVINIFTSIILCIFIGSKISEKYRELVIIASIILCLVVVIYPILKWRKTTITIDDTILIEEADTIFKIKNTILLNTISNVNLVQNIFEKIMGVYKLKIDTNTSSTANETDITIILKKEKAFEVKGILEGQNNKEKEADKYDIEYSTKDIISSCIYSLSLGNIIYIIMILIIFIINFKGEEIIKIKNVYELILCMIFFITTAVYGFVKNIFKFYGFKVGRKDDKLYVSYGLLTRKKYIIPIDKINAIIVDEYTIGRIFKRKCVEIVNVGTGDEEDEGAFVLLSEKGESLKERLRILLPEYNLEEKLEKQPKKSLLINIFSIAICGGIIVLSYYSSWYYLALILIILLRKFLIYFNKGIKVDKNNLILSEGCFVKKTKYINYKKIQQFKITKGPICSSLKLAKGSIFILGSIINTVHSTGYYNQEVFEEINRKIF